jgi:xylulokinase
MTFLSIDIGSSHCRAALIADGGQIESIMRHPVGIVRRHALYAELDCCEAWKGVRTVVGRLLAANPGTDIAAVGISAMLGYVLLDKHCRPLGPAVLYADNRALDQIENIRRIVPGDEIYRLTGRRLAAELLAPKLLWFKTHRPAHYARVHAVLGLKDEMVRRLTGVVATDMAHANYSMVFNVAQGEYDRHLIRAIGLDADKLLPAPVFCDQVIGRVATDAASELGLQAGTPVVAGSSDGTTAMYGGGLHTSNRAVLVTGSTDVLMVLADDYPRDRSMTLTVNTGPDASTFLVGGATGYSGMALRRFEHLLNRTFDDLAPNLDRLPPGSDGLFVVPGLGGERAPYWRGDIAGMVHGLTMDHEPEHVFKALIEGFCYRIRKLLAILSAAVQSTESVTVVGGMGANRQINRIRAAVTGVPMRPLEQLEASCVGTAMFCRSGIEGGGRVRDYSRSWSRPAAAIAPDPKQTAVYARLAEAFEALVTGIQPAVRTCADTRSSGPES